MQGGGTQVPVELDEEGMVGLGWLCHELLVPNMVAHACESRLGQIRGTIDGIECRSGDHTFLILKAAVNGRVFT